MSTSVPALNAERVALLARHGVTITAIEPLGAKVVGLDLRKVTPPAEVLEALEMEMATRGYLAFAGQGVMTAEEQIKASTLWGGKEMHSTHGVHPAAPHRHIFRLSNSERDGILGVGPQWHNDGSFEVAVFSHVGYHIIKVPENGGDTMFAHQGGAFDALPAEKQEFWSKLVSVNATSGVVHPLVHEHPISGRKSVWLHLGMTGAVLENQAPKGQKPAVRVLQASELKQLMKDYHKLLMDGLPENGGNYTISYPYEEGDCIIIDNLAIAHRAAPEAHMSVQSQGLRILHRTTVKGMKDFVPEGFPPALNIYGPNPCDDGGAWVAGGLGFRWDETIHMQN